MNYNIIFVELLRETGKKAVTAMQDGVLGRWAPSGKFALGQSQASKWTVSRGSVEGPFRRQHVTAERVCHSRANMCWKETQRDKVRGIPGLGSWGSSSGLTSSRSSEDDRGEAWA